MSHVSCYILESFLFSEDGYTTKPANKGETIDIPERLFAGLNDARKVRRAQIGDGRVSLKTESVVIEAVTRAKDSGDARGSTTVIAEAVGKSLDDGTLTVEDLKSSMRKGLQDRFSDDAKAPAPQPPSRTADLTDSEEASLADGSWRGLKFFAKRSIAAKLSDKPINSGAEADAAIEAELARRAGE